MTDKVGTGHARHYYDSFYTSSGWEYSKAEEFNFLKQRIVEPLHLKKGLKLLDLGCGMGFHSHLFSLLGFEVTGVDLSKVGIKIAENQFSVPRFFCCNAENLSSILEYKSFDILFVRGMSWFHYELNGTNKFGVNVSNETHNLFQFLVDGGIFILQIKTDFSGSRPHQGVHDNKLEDYFQLFRPNGEVFFISDWRGTYLESQEDADSSKDNVIIATRK